jgi:hypothetical protein
VQIVSFFLFLSLADPFSITGQDEAKFSSSFHFISTAQHSSAQRAREDGFGKCIDGLVTS